MNIFQKYARHKFIVVLSIILVNCLTIGKFASDFTNFDDSNNNVDDGVKNETTRSNCCGNTTTDEHYLHRVEHIYKTTVVQNEFIVRFKNYYLPDTRQKYINDALNQSQVNLN